MCWCPDIENLPRHAIPMHLCGTSIAFANNVISRPRTGAIPPGLEPDSTPWQLVMGKRQLNIGVPSGLDPPRVNRNYNAEYSQAQVRIRLPRVKYIFCVFVCVCRGGRVA